MTSHQPEFPGFQSLAGRYSDRLLQTLALLLLITASSATFAQDVRYSWLDISLMGQDVGRSGNKLSPIPGQTVDAMAGDGNGIRFRGSLGTWNNMYLFMDYGATDVDVDVVVTNMGGSFPAQDEFDFTNIRGGLGIILSVGRDTDFYGEISYNSLDMDFGSFVGENFDTDDQDIGASLGVRTMLSDGFEVRAYGRYSNHGDVNLTTGEFDTDTLFGAGFGWRLIRGLSIVGDYESGEFSNWSIGFRLDLDED